MTVASSGDHDSVFSGRRSDLEKSRAYHTNYINTKTIGAFSEIHRQLVDPRRVVQGSKWTWKEASEPQGGARAGDVYSQYSKVDVSLYRQHEVIHDVVSCVNGLF